MTPMKTVASRPLPAIHAHATAWEHPCGLRHIHIHAPDPHLSMMIHVPTISDTDDGVAHALEHMVMEGSASYPVDNIIARLGERTMSTFMNAMTSPGATLYPFSSANPSDFTHIAQVYLDCVFNPRLPRQAFASEVARVSSRNGQKAFDGVVFNEMRGVFSDPARIEHQATRRWLAPDSPLSRNSGGDPLHIVDLTLDRLGDFHATHYHPSRCTIVSYGNLDPSTLHGLIDQAVSSATARQWPDQAPATPPSVASACDQAIDVPSLQGQAGHGLLLAWPLPQSNTRFDQSLHRAYAAMLARPGGALSDCLDDLSPASVSQCSPVIVANRHYLLIAAHDLSQDQVQDARERILGAMAQTLENPPHPRTMQSILNDVHLSMLMRAGSSGNLGQHLCLSIVQALENNPEPAKALAYIDDDDLLSRLRAHPIDEDFPKWLASLVQARPCQAWVRPDPGYHANTAAALDEKLQSRPVQPDPVPRSNMASSLPMADCSPGMVAFPPPAKAVWTDAAPGVSVCHIPSGVEGVYTIDLAADLSAMDPSGVEMVQSAIMLANMVGVGDVAWKEHAAQRQQDGFSPSVHTDVENMPGTGASIFQRISQATLPGGLENTCRHMLQMVSRCHYDPARLSIILASVQEDLRARASERAHEAAHVHALLGTTAAASFNAALRGIEGDLAGLALARLAHRAPDTLVQALLQARDAFMDAPMAIRVIGPDVPPQVLEMARRLSDIRPGRPAYAPGAPGSTPAAQVAPTDTAFLAPMHVNSCVQSWPGPRLFDPQGPAAGLLAQVVSDQYLYGALRDRGGAYGADFSWSDGCFRATSYRDPRMRATFADFSSALDWAQSGAITQEHLNQARIKQLSHLTRPTSLFKRAQNAWSREVLGVDANARDRFAARLLATTLQDLHAVATGWLSHGAATVRSASIGPQWANEAAGMGMDIIDVPCAFSPPPPRPPSP